MNFFYSDVKEHKDDTVDDNTVYRSLSENIEMLEAMHHLKGNDDTDEFYIQVLHDLCVSIKQLAENKSMLIRSS